MRALFLILAAALGSGASADDRFLCTPAADGSGWSCVGKDGATRPVASAPAPAIAQSAAKLTLDSILDANLDWVPRQNLPVAQQVALPAYCNGAYVQPQFPLPLGTDGSEQPLQASAQSAQYWLGDRAVLSGGVDVRQGNATLTSREATYLEADETVTVDGDVTLRQPGLLMRGSGARLAVRTGAAQISNAEFVIHDAHLRGTAATLNQTEDKTLMVERGRFTRCEPGDESWSISSRSVVIEDGANHGVARHAVLRAGVVPVMYTPYIRFPVTDERLSGFLFPDLGYSDENGLDVALPYYFNLAPNYDATLTPRYIAERGAGGELEVRHLSRWTHTEIGGAYLVDDDLYNGDVSQSDFEDLGLTGPFEPADRWLGSMHHEGRVGAFASAVDFAEASDEDYFRDLGTNLDVTSQVQLNQYAALSYGVGGLSMRLWAQDFQNLDPLGVDPYRRLPELALRYQGDLIGPLNWSMDAITSQFERNNEAMVGIDRLVGNRTHLEPRVELPLSWPFGFLRAGGGFRYTQYDLDDADPGIDDSPERDIWMGYVDGGLFFERDSSFFGGSFLQTLEPRVYYLSQQGDDQSALPLFDTGDLTFTYSQLFRDNRFGGLDRIGDANQVSIGVTNRLLESATGRERVRASIGQIFYLEDREVTLRGTSTTLERQSSSAVAGELALNIGRGFSLGSSIAWDPYDDDWNEIGGALQYAGSNRGVFNIGYRSRRDIEPHIEQVDVSMYWPALTHWAVLARWNYDLETEEIFEAFGGIEYNNCCWQARIVARRFLRSPDQAVVANAEADDGIFLQIVFKGLAGFGGRIDALMEKGIRGYRPEEF